MSLEPLDVANRRDQTATMVMWWMVHYRLWEWYTIPCVKWLV